MTNLLKTEYLTSRNHFNTKKKMDTLVIDSIIYYTSFLDYDASILTRAHYILHNIKEQIKCETCSTPLRFTKKIDFTQKYCSYSCRDKSPLTLKKRKETNLEKFGMDNPFKNKELIKDSMMKKYGVDNPSRLDEVKKKIKEANINNAEERMEKAKLTIKEKYGVEHASQIPSVKEKIKNTCIEKYGSEYYFTSSVGIEKIKQTLLEKYDTDNVFKTPEVVKQIKKTKKEKYGDENYNNREKAKQTMNEIYGDDYSRFHWNTDTSILIHDKKLLEDFIKNKTVSSAASELNISDSCLRKWLYRYDVFTYDGKKNQYESMITAHLDKLGVYYEKNKRNLLDNGLELDFYLPDYSLAIEVNGIFWHSELMGKDKTYHINKTTECKKHNINLVHIWDYQIDNNPELVLSMISSKVGKSNIKIGARKTSIVVLDNKTYSDFLKINHLHGSVNSRFRYGLVSEQDNLVAVMGFGYSRFQKNEIEMYRFAVKQNHNIQGAASKLLKYFTNVESCDRIISYANRDISNGIVYEKLGFELIAITPPNYHYFMNRTVYSRHRFQKHKLKNILSIYDENLTEWDNMKNNGYNRFWDTGNLKYEYKSQ